MTRRDWWLGLALLLVAGVCYALFPRYECRTSDHFVRVDRWTGTVTGICR